MNGWKEVWNKNMASERISIPEDDDALAVFAELKAFTDPNYQGRTFPVDNAKKFIDQFKVFLREMAFSVDPEYEPASFFDVGCSTGPYLYYLSKVDPSYRLGGVDYSSSCIDVAKRYVQGATELYSGEAAEMSTDITYDCVFSRSIFQYFADLKYGETVVKKMIEKSGHSVGIFDVHDLAKKDDFLAYRRSVVENYDEKYKDTQHLFYPKSMFIEIAEECDCDVKFAHCALPGYWNAPFTYDVYFYKRK